MEIDNPHGDFLITCSHGNEGSEPTLIARIAGDSEVLTDRNTGSGVHSVGTSHVAENTENRVAHFTCPGCSYDVQLQPDTLRSFVTNFRSAGLTGADLAVLQQFATRPYKAQ